MGGGRAVPHAASMGLPARPGTRVLFDFQGTEPNAERRSVILPCPEMWRCVWRWDWVFISDGHLGAGLTSSSRKPTFLLWDLQADRPQGDIAGFAAEFASHNGLILELTGKEPAT